MSFPIPSFFKIRCGIIIIAFLLFFMFIGMLKQAFAACSGEIPSSYQNGWEIKSTIHSNRDAAISACRAEYEAPDSCHSSPIRFSGDENLLPSLSGWEYFFYDDNLCGPPYKFRMCFYCPSGYPSSCPDSDSNGKPDVCEPCPSQSGYKANFGLFSYCGQTTTFCDGQRLTEYEFGFGPDSCLPAEDPPCCATSVEAGCRKDTDCDGIADIYDIDMDNDGALNTEDGDVDGDSIPNRKDIDTDSDGDQTPDPNDPCPGNPDPNCVDPCAGDTSGTCKDTDGDGIKDSEDDDIDGDDITNAKDNDIDGDGKNNDEDTDVDGDGTPNTEEDDIDGDGVPNSEDDDDDSDATPDDEEDSDGDGIPDGEETTTRPYAPTGDPYSVKEETQSEFKEALKVRFQEFLNKLKTTSLFSIPSRLNNIVPTGSGDSKIIVNGGQTYGQNEIDFSGWTQGLASLNALVYMACYSLAIRIIILKR